jgi:alanine dehydrogenase
MALILSRDDVQHVLTMSDVIDALEQAHAAMARGQVVMPVRLTMVYDDQRSVLGAMPACIQSEEALGIKVITNRPANGEQGLPAIHALIALFDYATGVPLAIMDGAYITAVRTGAASGMATRHLAREDAQSLAILGAGVQGYSHLDAMLAVREVTDIRIHNRTRGRAEQLAESAKEKAPGATVRVVDTEREAVDGADIIVAVTAASEPIIEWSWLKAGTHINGVGSHSPKARELPTEVVVNSRIVVDSIAANLSECADIMLPIEEGRLSAEQVDTEIGHVVAGIKPGRRSSDEVTLYKSVGIGLQDVATARLVYQRAKAQGVGVEAAL